MKLLNTSLTNLINLKKFYFFFQIKKNKKIDNFMPYFYLVNHKKLHYFIFNYNLKHYVCSAGRLLQKANKFIKFFKKSRKNITVSINILNKNLKNKFQKVNFFICKNFNYKNYLWLKKYQYLIKPQFNYLVLTNSWDYISKQKRRIKKKIIRNLIKNNKINI